MAIAATITLDLSRAGIKMPGGRAQAEEILLSEYIRLARPVILSLPVDSSRSLHDLLATGDLSTALVDQMAFSAKRVPPVLSSDFTQLTASRTIDLKTIAPALVHNTNVADTMQTLRPVSTPPATGILILAYNELPVHGRAGFARAMPCLFPKIWDSDMNLIYGREMTTVNLQGKETGEFAMVRYTGARNIFENTPSGINAELATVIGENPLRIIASGVFGIRPTDIIIDRDEARVIISGAETRALLREGRVAIVLSDQVLRSNL
jgi:hypothetical protein